MNLTRISQNENQIMFVMDMSFDFKSKSAQQERNLLTKYVTQLARGLFEYFSQPPTSANNMTLYNLDLSICENEDYSSSLENQSIFSFTNPHNTFEQSMESNSSEDKRIHIPRVPDLLQKNKLMESMFSLDRSLNN